MKIRAILSVLLFVLTFSFSANAAEQVYYYHTDPVGTPLSMTDSSGIQVWKADYKPFGEENSVTGSAANNKRFVGKEKDAETGFSYFGARYEDAKTGRFIAVDPVGAVDSRSGTTNEKQLLDPQRLNLYAYSLNNPYRYVDPDGRFTLNLFDHNKHAEFFNRAEAARIKDQDPNVLSIEGHGNSERVAGRDAVGLEKVIRESGYYSPGMTVRLNSCRSAEGANSIAEQLASRLDNSYVLGSERPVLADNKSYKGFSIPFGVPKLGGTFIPLSPIPADWTVFSPSGMKASVSLSE